MPPADTVDLCLAALRFYPVYAGPGIRFKRYEAGFRVRGIRMRVFSGEWEYGTEEQERSLQNGRVGELLSPEEADGVPVQRVRLRTDQYKRMLSVYDRALARYCRRDRNRPDVIQFLTLWSRSLPWLYSLKLAGIPLVYTHTQVRPGGDDGLKAKLKGILYRLPFGAMDCVVTSSGVMRQHLVDAGVRTRIEVIPNGLDLTRFRPVSSETERREIRHRLQLDLDSELILFAGGTLNPRKGIDVLAEAWRLLAPQRPRARLVLVGPEYDELKPEGPQADFLRGVRRSLQRSGAGERVVFTGAVSNVEDYLRVADVFVFPSRREGMPNVVPEAFGCGAPVVLTPFIGLPAEFGRADRHYVLADRTPRDLARAISGLLENPSRRRSLALEARRWVERELDVEASLDRYAQLYRELTFNSKKRRSG